jgi:hypothetical protein
MKHWTEAHIRQLKDKGGIKLGSEAGNVCQCTYAAGIEGIRI